MKITKAFLDRHAKVRKQWEKEAADAKAAAEAAEKDLAKDWNRVMIHEPARREKERRARKRAILARG